MTKPETIKILTFMHGCYGNKFKYPQKSNFNTASLEETWFLFLHSFAYVETIKAVKSLCLQKPDWPPTPAEVVNEIINPLDLKAKNLSGQKAWQLVLKAVKKYGIYQAGEALESLPDHICEALDSIGGFDMVALSDNQNTYLYHQFLKAYDALRGDQKAVLLSAASDTDSLAGYLVTTEGGVYARQSQPQTEPAV